MALSLGGIHHITAIASDPQRNLDFYTGVLGLRLVKLTVNFDDPGTYHLYFADGEGNPGTVLTFFPWPGARRGTRGNGQVATTAFAVPAAAIDYWANRLQEHGVTVGERRDRFGEEVLGFTDGDGTYLELVAERGETTFQPWSGGPVPAECAIRGFHHAALWVEFFADTIVFMVETLGFDMVAEEERRVRLKAGDGSAVLVDVVQRPDGQYGRSGAGTVHHIAWRTADDEQQEAWREELIGQGFTVTPVKDRQYFHSIYFREPGGILFEIATEPPGFTLDEERDALGRELKLPPWLESRRAEIETVLPALQLPEVGDQ